MHLWPRGRRNLGPLQGVPPVQRTGHPHRLKPNPHHRTARRMADAVPATQQLTTVLKQNEVLEAVHGELVPTAVYTLLCTHAEDPQATAAHMQRTAVAKTAEQLTYHTHKNLQHAATLPPNRPSPPPQTPVLPTMRTYPVTYQHGTPTTPTHHPPSTTLARHTRAPQAPHTRPPACARHQPPSPHSTVRLQVPPTASHRMSPLRTPAATTDGPALQPGPLGLPESRAPPHPLPRVRGPQRPPPRAARGPSRNPPRQPPQLLQATHRHPPGPPGRELRGGRGGPRMDHSRGHGQHTPAPPKPNLTPQRRRLERGGPPHPPRPIPPP